MYSRNRRAKTLGVVAAGGLVLSGLTVLPAMAGDVPPFTVDGIPEAGALVYQDPFGNSQELGPKQQTGPKIFQIQDYALPVLDTSQINKGTDITKVSVKSATDGDGDIWVDVTHTIEALTTGQTGWEFMKTPPPAGCDYTQSDQYLIDNCNPWANRAAGDFFIFADYQGNAVQLVYRAWEVVNGAYQLSTPVTIPSTVGQAAVKLDTNTVEVAVNFSALFPNITECVTIGNIIPSTLTGNSDSADYKDVVLAPIGEQAAISNCGSVKIIKELDPADATVPEGNSFDWTLDRDSGAFINYDDATNATGTFSGAGNTTIVNLITGTDYQLTESINGSAFSLKSIICVLNGTSTDITAGGTFEIAVSKQTVCTIVNKENQGELVVKKVVVNDNGGTATPDAFSFAVSGPTASTANQFEADGANNLTVSAGTYNVTETVAAGYEETGNTCVNVVVPAGGSAECTITNDDIAPSLTLKKEVTNDNGGQAVATDFTLTATGPTPISGPGGATSDATFKAGSYTLSETTLEGYTAGDWVCVGGTQVGNTITLGLAESATCTITNNDTPASPTGTTTMSWTLSDSLEIAGLREGAPNAADADVTFTLYSDDECSAEVGSETVDLVGTSAATANGIDVTDPGTYYWRATYTGDQYNTGFTTACGSEVTTIGAVYNQ